MSRTPEALMVLFREHGWALAISDGEAFDPWQRVAFILLADALAAPTSDGLDVERLANAMVAWWHMERPLARQDQPVEEWMAADARLIAAEYARLTPDRTPTEEERS